MRSLGLPISKANRLLLICDSEANIGTVDANVVFIEGTTSILETSHQHVLGMNFFSVGLTLKSLL